MTRKKLLKNEVIKIFNTTKETLRHYENKGLLKPSISNNNYRYYDFNDLQKLRQIFLLKNLDISLDKMKELDEGKLDKKDYIKLLENRKNSLNDKINKLKNIQSNIIHLIDILKSNDNKSSYLLIPKDERHYYALNTFDSEIMESPKAYYDNYKDLILEHDYSEKQIEILYTFNSLGTGEFINPKICIEIPVKKDNQINKKDHLFKLEEGLYLSIFYEFEHGSFNKLPKLKEEIDEYLINNNLKRTDEYVMEKEHPELSLFLDENISVFELQIRVTSV